VKIAVSSWSLYREVPEEMNLVDFIQVCVDRFGIAAVELCQSQFSSTDHSYLKKIKQQLAG